MSYVMIKYFNIGFRIRAIPLIIKINMYVVIEMLENSQFFQFQSCLDTGNGNVHFLCLYLNITLVLET